MAIAASDIESFLRKNYIPEKIEWMSFQEHPRLAMIAKKSGFGVGGTDGVEALTVGTEFPQGGSNTFSVAQANAASAYHRGARFALTATDHYQIAQLERKLVKGIEASGQKNVMFKRIEEVIDGHIQALTRQFAVQLYRKGWGKIGSTATAAAAQDTLTLQTIEDAVNFAEGQTIVAAETEDSGAFRNSGASIIVESVAYDTGIITFTTNINDIAALAVSDSLFIKGTRHATAASRLCVAGYLDWSPITAPSGGESFFGKDRSGNSRLYGAAIDCSTMSKMEGIVKGVQACRRFGGRPSHLFLNTGDYGDLVIEMQARGTYEMTTIKAGTNEVFGFPAVKLITQFGTVLVVDDPECPKNYGCLEYLADATLGYVGNDGDGPVALQDAGAENKSLVVYNADALEFRVGGYPQHYKKNPGWSAVLKFV